ncbi:ABC transporter ATP-binding protein [Candidatus Pyrohabitans sp.]
MIKVENVSKKYRDFRAVDNISFKIDKGEIFGVVGPNGAGKTSVIKMIVGLIEPSQGDIWISDYSIRNQPEEAKRIIGYLPEETPVYEDMTAEEYLSFFGEIYGIEKQKIKETADSILDDLNLKHRNRKLGEMSKGMRRKVAIARSLINNPEVLVYDEPTSGLDPITSNYVMEYIRSLRGEKTILLTTHNLYQAEKICDRVLILKDGRKVAMGPVEDVKQRFGGIRYALWFKLDNVEEIGLPVENRNGFKVAFSSNMDEINYLAKEVFRRGGDVVRIEHQTLDLEEVFLRAITQNYKYSPFT